MKAHVLLQRKIFSSFLVLLFLLSACQSSRPAATQSVQPVLNPATSIPIVTSKPTITPSPTLKPATPTPTPTQTPTPAPTVSIPYLITPGFFGYETPTPITSPGHPLAQYSLKEWNEQSALDFIRVTNAYSSANHIEGIFRSLGSFVDAQWSVRLAALEFLARYKNSPYEKDVRWRLAYADAWLGNSESDQWLIHEIENGLNTGTIRMESLESALAPYGFEIITKVTDPQTKSFGCFYEGSANLPISDIFDSAKAQVLTIRAIEQGTGLVVVLSEDINGHYEMIPVRSGWDFSRLNACQTVAAQDLTGDGVPEIVISEAAHSGSMVAAVIYIYQWQNGRFTEVTDNGIPASTIDLFSDIEVNAKTDGSKTIVVKPHGPDDSNQKEVWKWNGSRFIDAGSMVTFPVKAEDIYNRDVELALENGQYKDVIDQFSSQEERAKLENKLGLSQEDYLTFMLAVSHALMFQADETKSTLQSLVNNPVHPELTALPNAARRFLAAYHNETDLYRACLAAQIYYQGLPEGVGVPIGVYQQRLDLCGPQTMFAALLGRLAPTLSEDVPAALSQFGVQLSVAKKLDINEDGKTDWLLVPDFGLKTDNSIWFLIKKDQGYQILSSPIILEKKPVVGIQSVHLPGESAPSFFLGINHSIYLYRFIPVKGTFTVEQTYLAYSVRSYEENQSGNSFVLNIIQDPKYADRFSPFHFLLEWDQSQKKFIEKEYYEQSLLESVEPGKRTPEILNALNQFVPQMGPEFGREGEAARFRYLLGLSYELSGDRRNAARVYYELWRARPDNQYAVMAREKLQLTNP